ncbi:MAG: helix-hairpin-helix domain-containing protein [Thermotogae bacterium]|nr:helix-hairpin-helix domain-containing protein [Thermotogota bacterium]
MFSLLALVPLNSAPLKELRRVFPAPLADSIYKYRQRFGGFRSLYQLLEVPGMTPAIFREVKDSLILYAPSDPSPGSGLGARINRIISSRVSEEAPSDLSRAYWLFLGGNPININEATVLDLANLPGVSLKDAVRVVQWRKYAKIKSRRDLRWTPGLTLYGYRNLRRFVIYRDTYKPLRGFLYARTYAHNHAYDPSSYFASSITQLYDTSGMGRNLQLLREAGWSDEAIEKLIERLKSEAEDITTTPKPKGTFRGTFRLWDRLDLGFYHYGGYTTYNKVFAGLSGRYGRLLVGDYRFSFGNGLIFTSSEDLSDRVYWNVVGLMPDILYGDAFKLRGVGLWGNYGGFSPFLIYSKTRKDAVVDTAGRPLFYYSSEFIPSLYEDKIGEEILGGGLNYMNDNGFGAGFMLFQLRYDEPFSGDWGSVAVPFYSSTFNGGYRYDPSFRIDTGRVHRFGGITYSAVVGDFVLRGDLAANLRHMKPSALLVFRYVGETRSLDFVYRNYDPTYWNPYARPFKEDNRFERTDFRYSYRLLDPLATNLADLPLPKPEEGYFFQIRDRLFQDILLPRIYMDVWRDRTDGMWNRRLHAEVEWRVVWALRMRVWRRWLERTDMRYGRAFKSRSVETAFRTFIITDAHSAVGMEVRYAQYKSDNPNVPPGAGSFFSAFFNTDLLRGLRLYTGATVWTSNGYSLWVFEDDGIDFLYNRGGKIYVAVSKEVLRNAHFRIKLHYKKQYNDGNSLISASGDPINVGLGRYEYFTTYATFAVAF